MSSRNKGRGGSSQPSNSGGKGPASKSAAPSVPTSNGNATRGGKGTNVNPPAPTTQSANSGNPPSTNSQSTTSWSSVISKQSTNPKTVTVDLTKSTPKQTSSSAQNTKESPANTAPNQTSTNTTSVPNNAPLNPTNTNSNQKPTEDTLPQKTKVEAESKPSTEKDKPTPNPPVKSTPSTSGSLSTPEQTKGNQQPLPQPTPIPSTPISSSNTSVTSPSANLSVKAPVFKPSSINPSAAPFARTHSAPPSLEEQQKAFTGMGEQASTQGMPYYIPQKGYFPSYYPPPGPAPINYPRMYQASLFVPTMQGPPNQPLGVSVGPNSIPSQPLVAPTFSTGGNLQQTTPTVPPGPRRNAIPIIDPKTGKEVSTADSPPKQRPKSSSISPAVTPTAITATTPVSSTTAPTQPITSTPSTQTPPSTNNVGVQPLASNNTNQSGINSSTSQKPITTTGPGGILPELGSMNVSQSKDKGASTTSASTTSAPSASTSTTSSDKQPSTTVAPTIPVSTSSPASTSTQETTPVIEAKPEKKKKMKEILKKAEEGTYKAASFDPYTSNEEKKSEEKKSTPAVTTQESTNPPKSTQPQKQESEEDNWETKDEKELVNLKNKQTSNDNIPSTSSVASDTPVNYKKVISYPPGVWSPDNTHGKMVYDRNFMIQFQDMEFCREKPKEMADMDELMSLSADDNVPGTPKESRDKDKQWNRQSGNFGGGKGMKRTESNSNLSGSKGSSASNTPMSTPGSQRRDTRNGPNRRTDSKKKLRSSGTGLSTPLPPDVAPLATSENRWEPSRNKQITEEERVHRKVTSLLNKLTEETYAKLSEKLLKVEIKTVDILKDIIKIVFDKAIWEPKFVKMYAEICTQLSKVSPEFTVDEKVHNFKRLLLNRCQEEFESAFKGSKNIKDKENEPQEEVPVVEDANKTPSDKGAQDEIELRAKKQMMGNVGFIGELFKAGMLTEKIMHDCLSLLLGDIKSPSDIHIEALCRLMGSIGAEIDHQKAKKWMDQYFARMKELAKNQALPSRIRFMLEDCILMRENNWLTRREVQKEVESKAPATPVKQANIRIAPRGSLTPTNTKDSRTSKYEDDDWEVVGKSGNKSRPPTSSKPQEDLALRPQTFGPMNSGLSRGAKGWSTKATSAPADSKAPKESKAAQPTPSVPEKELTVEEVETKMDDILEEYFSSNDAPEAVICIKELKSPSAHASIVTKGILIGLEKREKERIAIANLFSSLFSSSLFSSDTFVKGITGVLDTLEDLSIDIPQAPSYIAFFIAHGLLAGYLSKANISTFLSILGGDSSKSSKSNDSSQFLADIIYYCSTITNESKARDIIDKNELKASLFKSLSGKSSGDADSFNFKFLTDKKISGILPNDSIDLMFKLNHPISKIKTWVEEELGEQSLSDVKVNRGITRSVLSKSFTRSLNDDKQRENFKQNAEILKPFLDQNVQQQVQTLLEIQYFVSSNNLPKGTLEKVFEILHELRLVSGKAFIAWEKSSDDLIPENSKSKAEFVKQVDNFLQKMKNNPQQDDEGEDGGEDDDQEEMEE